MNQLDVIRLQIKEREANIKRLREMLDFEKDSLLRLKELKTKLVGELLYVRTDLLSEQIKLWVQHEGNTVMGLALQAGLDEKHIRIIRDNKTTYTTEVVADKILIAMGKEYMLGTELELVKIPRKPFSHYEEE